MAACARAHEGLAVPVSRPSGRSPSLPSRRLLDAKGEGDGTPRPGNRDRWLAPGSPRTWSLSQHHRLHTAFVFLVAKRGPSQAFVESFRDRGVEVQAIDAEAPRLLFAAPNESGPDAESPVGRKDEEGGEPGSEISSGIHVVLDQAHSSRGYPTCERNPRAGDAGQASFCGSGTGPSGCVASWVKLRHVPRHGCGDEVRMSAEGLNRYIGRAIHRFNVLGEQPPKGRTASTQPGYRDRPGPGRRHLRPWSATIAPMLKQESPEGRRTRAIEAAAAIARTFGIDASECRILEDANNTIVHLVRASVVAKVGTTTIRKDAGKSLATDVAVGAYVAARGGPVAELSPEVPPEVHWHQGTPVTFWTYYRPFGSAAATDVVSSLRQFHDAFDGFDGRLPNLSQQIEELTEALIRESRTPELRPADRRFLLLIHAELLAELRALSKSNRPLHGDPHERNRIATAGGIRWIDFEAACRGPIEWDVSALDDSAAAYYGDLDVEALRLMSSLRSLRVSILCWMQIGRTSEINDAAEFHLRLLKGRRT